MMKLDNRMSKKRQDEDQLSSMTSSSPVKSSKLSRNPQIVAARTSSVSSTSSPYSKPVIMKNKDST